MRKLSQVAAASVVVGLIALGCSNSKNPTSAGNNLNGPANQTGNPTQIGQNVGAASAGLWDGNIREMHGGMPGFGLPFPPDFPSGCDYDATSHTFICPPDTVDGGLAITRSYAYADSAGNPQSAYDATTTASIHFLMHESGTLHRARMSRAVDETRDITESGLQGNETTHIWNGTDSGVIIISGTLLGGLADSSSTTITETIQSVVLPYPPARNAWPLSGTISRDVKMEFIKGRFAGQSLESTSSITFNGTEFVPMTIDGQTITVDLRLGCMSAGGGGGHGGNNRGGDGNGGEMGRGHGGGGDMH